ncbi:MAG: hypothetical protein SH821_09605 [Phototrophicales bacterium]|nr:hypothetical protein [Phototrophicales bacterium]
MNLFSVLHEYVRYAHRLRASAPDDQFGRVYRARRDDANLPETIYAFNAYFAEQQASWSWDKMRAFAIETTTTVHQMFTNPVLLNAERLERTKIWRKRLNTGDIIPNIAVGWSVWFIALEHIATEHVIELGLV